MNKWLEVRIKGSDISRFFSDNRLNGIAVYGAGALGRRMLDELRECGLDIRCVIDRNARDIVDIKDIPVVNMDDEWPEVDVIVITPIFFYEISSAIREKIGNDVNIVAIDDVIDYCYMELMR